MVSTSPKREDTEKPFPTLISTSAELAPSISASRKISKARFCQSAACHREADCGASPSNFLKLFIRISSTYCQFVHTHCWHAYSYRNGLSVLPTDSNPRI